jgi:hypothetical protein
MVVTVVANGNGASGRSAEHGGGCPLTCRAGAGLPARPLQVVSTRAANTGSTETSRLQVRRVRTGDWVPVAADGSRPGRRAIGYAYQGQRADATGSSSSRLAFRRAHR